MDPVSAFGLAVNILTVIDLSVKVISTASDIWSHGQSIITSDRAKLAQHFESLCRGLIESSKTTSKHSDVHRQAIMSNQDDAALHQLAEEAKTIASDIQQGLIRRQKEQAPLKTLRDAFLSVWGEREMKEKTERLKEMRAEIQFGLIVSIKASINNATSSRDQNLQKIDDATQQIIATLSSDNDTIRMDMERRVRDLNQEVVSYFDQASRLASQRHDEVLNAIAGSSGLATIALPEDPARITKRILGRLWFPTIHDRYEDILPAHKKTFQWIFSRDLQLHPSSTFVEWIENGKGVFWMSGRAGSGKSTLIKSIADDPRTQLLLRTWAHGQPLVTAKYLFWDQSPDVLQKSLDGLFRGILYDIIRKETSFAPLLFPDQFKEENGWSGAFPTSNELKRAFGRLVSLESSPTQVALLIDGLDEYSAPRGAQHDLAETLKRAACYKHMKIVASSRPETVFEKAFADCEKLYLHDMTSRDRTMFVSDKLYEHHRTSYLVNLSGSEMAIDCLIQAAVERSEGIFLWLRLVVEGLIQELDVCESIRDLQSLLFQFPRGLEKLFLHMMRRMLRENGIRGFECLWIMQQSLCLRHKQSPYRLDERTPVGENLASPFRLTALCMDGAQLQLDTVLKAQLGPLSSAALEDTVTKVQNRLRNWCAGLLELKSSSVVTLRRESTDPEVAFIHRSVSEFLKLPTTCSDLTEELVETPSDVDSMLMKGLLFKLKREAMSWDFHYDSRIWVFVELIMRLAQFANDDERHVTHALLSELDRSMMSLVDIRQRSSSLGRTSRRHFDWTCHFPWAPRNGSTNFRPCDNTQISPGFLSIAVENGLAEFFLYTLNSPEMKSSVDAAMSAQLLNSACRPPPFSIAIPGTIRPAIIHRLLDLGADPNQVCQDELGQNTTSWKSMLMTVNDLEIMTVEGARQFAEILTAMVNHGADVRVRIRTQQLSKRENKEYVGGDSKETSISTKAMISSPDSSTASHTTGQHRRKPRFNSHCPSFALSEAQIEASMEPEEELLYVPSSVESLLPVPSEDSHLLSRQWKANSISVRDIIRQSFIITPSLRKQTYGAYLPGKFVPFEEIDSTWEIRDTKWGRNYGATYPDNFHPPKLTRLEKEGIKNLGLALLKLLDQKNPTQHADSEDVRSVTVENTDAEAVQTVIVKGPRFSKREKFRTRRAELLARFRK